MNVCPSTVNTFGHNRCELREFDLIKSNLPETMLYYFKQLNYFFKKVKGFLRGLKLKVVRNPFRRSERREACYLVLGHLLNHVDLGSFNIRRGKGMCTYVQFTVEKIAEVLGLSWSRVQRALADLKAAGYLSEEKNYLARGKFSTRFVLLRKLFEHLNIKIEDVKKSSWYAETSKAMKSRYGRLGAPSTKKALTKDSRGFVVSQPPPDKPVKSIKSLLKQYL